MLLAGAFAVGLIPEKELVYGNVQQGDKLVKGVEAWMPPRFSIYMMERGVRSTSWARYSCVQPFASRLRLISRPRV